MADALAQIPGLAHINDRPETVPHQVNARFMRERRDLFAYKLGHWHARGTIQAFAWNRHQRARRTSNLPSEDLTPVSLRATRHPLRPFWLRCRAVTYPWLPVRGGGESVPDCVR